MTDWAQLATVITALGLIVGSFLRHIAKKDDRTETAIVNIVDKHAAALNKMTDEVAERSTALYVCVHESNRLQVRSIDTIEKVTGVLDEHRELIRDFRDEVAKK